MPFEEDSLEEDKEYTSHPFAKELQEEMLKDFREDLERLHELDEQEANEKLEKKHEPVELTKTMIFAVPLKTKEFTSR